MMVMKKIWRKEELRTRWLNKNLRMIITKQKHTRHPCAIHETNRKLQ